MTPKPAARAPFALDARAATYALIGAALYGVLGLIVFPFGPLVVRPGFALVPFFGYSFGPLAGFATGFVGQAIVEGIGGVAPADSWAHGLASGLAGLVAGLASWYLPRLVHGTLSRRAIGGGVAGVIGSAVGGLALLLHNTGGTSVGNLLVDTYLPIAGGSALVALILVPVLVYAWDPLSESMAG
jgi:energy-coupling factor transport system substrate-specific component